MHSKVTMTKSRERITPSYLLLCAYVASLIRLPSGTVKGVPLKIVLFVPLLVLASGRVLRSPRGYWQAAVFIFAGGVVAPCSRLALSN